MTDTTKKLPTSADELNHYFNEISTFLEKTERPNILTFAQFAPFIDLFNADMVRYKKDEEYGNRIRALADRYSRMINRFYPTIIIQSEEDPTEIAYLDRIATPIGSINSIGESGEIFKVPSAVSPASGTSVDALRADAEKLDIVSANSTEEALRHFAILRTESSVLLKRFRELNASKKALDKMIPAPAADDAEGGQQASPKVEFDLDD